MEITQYNAVGIVFFLETTNPVKEQLHGILPKWTGLIDVKMFTLS
jgi:hypothetical protein